MKLILWKIGPITLLYYKRLMKEYYVYIITNLKRTVLYTGITNDLARRLEEHSENVARLDKTTFSGKYRCKYLLYFERFEFADEAIAREKEIKGWRRSRKEELICKINPEWAFLNDRLDELLSV